MAVLLNCKLVMMIMAVALMAIDGSGGHRQRENVGFWIPTTCISTWKESSIGEYGLAGAGEDQQEMESEIISRRILATNINYISYGALKKNRVPCAIRGATYYNCKPGAEANPYDRGCSHIARCRS
ncbi:hypothetical protein PTKIN_Ptkin06aG0211500 [Pterospermum kingtungense]